VELKLKTPWRDGTTHLVMTPLMFMQRLAALVPRPRLQRTSQPDCGRSRATLDGRMQRSPDCRKAVIRAALRGRRPDLTVHAESCQPNAASEVTLTSASNAAAF
jgi:hypothetical protein